jgi:hypothetical protein
MRVLAVSYDLDELGEQAYSQLTQAFKRLNARHILQSGWYVATTLTAIQLKAYLRPHLDEICGDKLDVHQVDPLGGFATMNLSDADLAWMRDRFARARRSRINPIPPRVRGNSLLRTSIRRKM